MSHFQSTTTTASKHAYDVQAPMFALDHRGRTLSADSEAPSRKSSLPGGAPAAASATAPDSPTHRRMQSNASSASMEPSTSYSSITDFAARYADSAPQSEAHSHRSSSSSLRHAYAALKGGVFPPGMRKLTRGGGDGDDTGSDVSHYDDDDDDRFSFENGGPFQAPEDSPRAGGEVSSDLTKPSLSDMYINALDSPEVPQRNSSVSSPTTATAGTRQSRSDTLTVNNRGDAGRRPSVESTTSHQTPRLRITSLEDVPAIVAQPARRQSKHRRHTPVIGEEAELYDAVAASPPKTQQFVHPLRRSPSVAAQGEGTTTTTTTTENTDKAAPAKDAVASGADDMDDAELQRRVEAEAAAADPNRPRTLKEARALAKERARLRSEMKGSFDAASSSGGFSPPTSKPSLPLRQGPTSKEGVSSPTSASDTTRSEHRHTQVVPMPAAQGSTEPQLISRATTETKLVGGTGAALNDMSDLQAAVGDALDDVSFSSSLTIATAALPTRSQDAVGGRFDASPGSGYLHPSSVHGHKDTDGDSNAASVQSYDSAPESPTTNHDASPYFSAVHIANIPAPAEVEQPNDAGAAATAAMTEGQVPAIQVIHTTNQLPRGHSYGISHHHPSLSESTMTPKVTSSFTPYALQAEQRYTAPNKIARLDVYGKTVRWPPAFDPTAIIEQRRLAPWERARSYAHYCNDLCGTPSGIQVWLDMVQRPAQRAAIAAASSIISPTTADFDHEGLHSRHLRGEATDGSGYAASVRSDATFPMRGDGGKAKELLAHHPSEATIPESPTGLPQNLPYPMLAGSAGQPLSSPTIVRHQSRASQDSLPGSNNNSISNTTTERRDQRGFFSSLGRKTSVRRTPGANNSMGSQGAAAALMGSSGNGSMSSPARNAISNMRARGIPLPSSVSASTGLRSAPSETSFLTGRQPSLPSPLEHSVHSAASTPNAPPSSESPTHGSAAAARNLPQGPRAFGNAPSYVGSLSSYQRSESLSSVSSPASSEKPGLHGISSAGGIYNIPSNASSNTRLAAAASQHPTDYSSSGPSPSTSPAMTALPSLDRRSPRMGGNATFASASPSVKSSLAYGSVRDAARRPTLQPPTLASGASAHSSDSSHGGAEQRRGSATSGHSFGGMGRRRSSNVLQAAPATAEEDAALDKLSDVLPDGDRATLLEYLRKAGGNDLVAIGDYLQDQSKVVQSKHMR